MQNKITICTLILVCAMLNSSSPAGLIGSNFQISIGSNYSRFADLAFDTANNKYLVVYTDYNAPVAARVCGRFITAAGVPIGGEICMSDPTGGFYGAVAYNPVSNLFLVTWDDQRSPFPIWGQLVSGTTGSLVGANFQIGSLGGIRSAVAASTTDNTFLVVWQGYALHDYGQRVTSLGTLIGSNFNISNSPGWYPAAAYASSGNQFLVTWDEESGHIYGQRVNAANGLFLGARIPITSWTITDRSAIAYDSNNAVWMVVSNDTSTPGNSYDQSGQRVSTSGALVGGRIPFASSPDFEGDTLVASDIGFLPNMGGRYFASFGGSGAHGQETSASGIPINGRITAAAGNIPSASTAPDPNNDRWLIIWEDQASGSVIFGQLVEATDLTPPASVTSFSTTSGSGQLTLNWTNPTTSDFAGTVIRWKLGSFPAHINDGTFLLDQPNTPGSNDSYVHMGLSSGFTYYYSAFAYDQHPNYASATHASGVPATLGDFDIDVDVDQKDFAHLQICFSGTSVPYASGCSDADLDNNGDVSSIDLNMFLDCLRGADQPPGC